MTVTELLLQYAARKSAIEKRLSEFEAVPTSMYFYELAYCLLTPQSSALHAEKVIHVLKELQFEEMGFDPESCLREKTTYIRFHRMKARHLLEMRNQFHVINSIVVSDQASHEKREWLVKNVIGLGYKEASHFLRNIGLGFDFAILDRHILRLLYQFKKIPVEVKSLSNKEYMRLERVFVEFAEELAIPVAHLDLLFWSINTGFIHK